MQKLKNKTITILMALFLTFSMTASMILTPTASAHTPPWTINAFAYVTAMPNPIGVGQPISVCMWVDEPMPGATATNGIRRAGYTLTITAPDGTTTTETFANITDPTGVQDYFYTPTQVGNYTFLFNYAGQNYTWTAAQSGTSYTGDIFTASNSTCQVTVQQAQLPQPIASYPLPTAYWTYPIEGQNTYWYTIASNWLGQPFILGSGTARPGAYQPYGTAPTSAHIMWTQPCGYGGVVGGNETAVPGEDWYNGLSYNPRFNNPIVMQGVLYYQQPYGDSGTGGNYVAVNLLTGQQLWSINVTATGVTLLPSFGYIYDLESPNQYGPLPNGLLIATTTAYPGLGTVWRAYDPSDGVLTTMNITNVPTGTSVAGPSGEELKYVLTNYGTSSKPNWYLAQWNSSDVFGGITGANLSPTTWYTGTENASLPSCYDWNISLNLPGTGWGIGSATLGPLVSLGNMMLLVQGTFGTHAGGSVTAVTSDPANITAISLKPNTIGQTLWTQSYQQAPNNVTRIISAWDPTTGVFIFDDKETNVHWGYSLNTGAYLWGPVGFPSSSTTNWQYFMSSDTDAYGNLYCAGYAGLIFCYNDATGALEWTYGNGGAGNSTNAGLGTPWGEYPQQFVAIADGMVYIAGDEHSPNQPMYKGFPLTCLNATTGQQIWTIFGWSNEMNGDESAIASGYLTFLNTYDEQIYCYGQGPSKLTVTAPQASIELGKSLVISGTVMDISAGTTQNEQAMDFPNGVPCVSDASQSAWMEYVYMQKPEPTNVTGVPVTISVIDSNGNYRTIGTATTDSSGMFSLQWYPDITGKYTVFATFAGSNSYYPSSDETVFAVDPCSPTASPYPVANNPLPSTEMYIGAAAAAIIIAIAIVGVLIVLMLRKRS